ncbi:MAG TPA: crossover junction endodeoxyribonuclease RuvC [Candidatus Saccharimonadales bacterium]|nr:crossover junction endodeoxyribonuclease RuvC [Candidatus Saccharimonadales bacterium]
MIILGIDPGTTGMGYAFLDAGADPATVLDCGQVDAPAGGSAAERLLAIANQLDALIARYAPGAVAIERLYFNKNVRTAMRVAEARGVALLCAARAGLAVAEYTPQEVKLSVTGSGAADKKQVQRMLAVLVTVSAPLAQDNVADAVAIALTHAQRSRFDAVVASVGTGRAG